jgi:hypothetical protein
VLEVGGDLDLGQKPLAADDGGELGVQHLDGHLAAVLHVFGQIHGGHAALSQLALETVTVGQGLGEAGRCSWRQILAISTRLSDWVPAPPRLQCREEVVELTADPLRVRLGQ